MTRSALSFNFPHITPPLRVIEDTRTGQVVAHVRAYTVARAIRAYLLRTTGEEATQLQIAYLYREVPA